MSGTRREVEFAIRAKDLSVATFQEVSAAVAKLTADLDKQILAASKGAISAGELRESLAQLKQAGDALTSQAALAGRFEKLTKTLEDQRTAATAAAAAQESYTATLNKQGEPTAASEKRMASLAGAVKRTQTAVEQTQATLTSLRGALEAAGVDTRDLTAAQQNLVNVAGQVGNAVTATNSSLQAYSGNLRRAREEAKALADAEKHRADALKSQAAPGFIRPNTPNTPGPAAAPGFISPNTTIPGPAAAPGFIRPNIGQAPAGSGSLFGLRPYELQNLGYQINDIVTQLASGTRASQVFAQQGGQVFQLFNKNLFDLLPLLPKIAAGIGVAVVALSAFNHALADQASTRQFNADITSTTNGVLYHADALTKARHTIQEFGTSWDDAGKLIENAITVGLNPARIVQFAKVSQDLSDRTGGKFSQIADDLVRVFTGPFDGIVKLNEQYGFWTAEQVKANRELAESGNLTRAAANAFDALRDKQEKAMKEGLSPWVQALRDLETIYRGVLNALNYSLPLQLAFKLWNDLANSIKAVAAGIKAVRELGSTPDAATPGFKEQVGNDRQKAIPADMVPIIADAAARAGLAVSAANGIYRNEAVRRPDGSFSQGQPNHTGELAEGAFQVLPSTFAMMVNQFRPIFDKLATDLGKPINIKTNEFNALAGSLYYKQQLDKYQDPGKAAGAYFAGPANFDAFQAGRMKPEVVASVNEYMARFRANAGLVTPDSAKAAAAAAAPSDPALIQQTEARKAASQKVLEDLRNQLIVSRALRDEETDRVRVQEAGKSAVVAAGALEDSTLKTIRATAEEQEKNRIATEHYAYAQKEAAEAVKSGANATKDVLARLRGEQEAYANGARTQQELDAAGDKAREIARAERVKGEQAILDVDKQRAAAARFGVAATQVLAAGQAEVNRLTALGVTGVETLRAARDQAQNEAFSNFQRQKALIVEGNALQSQLASLQRGDLKSPTAELAARLREVDEAYRSLANNITRFKAAGGTTVGTGANQQSLDQLEKEAAVAKARSITLTTIKADETTVNQIITERNAIVKTVNDEVSRGNLSIKEGEKAKQDAYNETNKALLPAIDNLEKVQQAAHEGGVLIGSAWDLARAKVREFRAETQNIDPLVSKLQNLIPETVGSSVVKGVETIATAIANLANGTGKLSDVWRSMGTAALGVLADITKAIGEAILKEYVMAQVSQAIKAGGGVGNLLSLIGIGGGGAAAGSAAAGTAADSAASYVGALAFHGGGIVRAGGGTARMAPAAWFANAPRLHEGALLARNERAAILLDGEEVLKRTDARNALNGGRTHKGGTQSIRNVLVLGDDELAAAMSGPAGEKVVVTHIKRNASSIKQLIG